MKVVVMDTQKGLVVDELYNYENFMKNVAKIIEVARENNVEVLYVQHDNGAVLVPGNELYEIADEFKPNPGEKTFVKHEGSCFSNKEFREYLESVKEDTLMIMGLISNYCVDTTVKAAHERGYKVVIPAETNSAFDNDYFDAETAYKYCNEDVWPEIADCVTMEDAIAMLKK